MEIFANIADTASNIFANSAANVAQAQMGIVVALFIISVVMMFIGWRFGSTRLLVAGGTIIVTGTGVIVFGQNIQEIGTNIISFAVGIALRAAGSGQSPDAFAQDFGTFYQPGIVHFNNMMVMADEACGVIGWMCGIWQPTYLIFAVIGWSAWFVNTIGALMFWGSVFGFKLGVIGALVLSAFFVWQTTRHISTAPIFFCIKAALYTFCITFMLTAGSIIMQSVPLVEEPAWYHALPLLVAVLAFACGILYSSKLAIGIGAGIVAGVSSMAAPAMQMIAAARAIGTGGGMGAILGAVAGARGSGGGGAPSGGGGNFTPNRAVQAMKAVSSFVSGGGGGPVQPTSMPKGGAQGGGIGKPTASQARSIKVGAGQKVSKEW